MGLAHRRRWRNRIALLAVLSVTVLAVSWLVRPAGAVLAAFSRKLVNATVRVEPILIRDYFLLQAVTCQSRFGLRCAPMTLPDGRGSVARRPSIDPANATSRREAKREIADGLGSASAWGRALTAGPGAALFTARFISSQGWEAWVSLALSVITAMTLLFWMVDSALVSIVLTPLVAIVVSWLLATILQALASSGPGAPLVFLMAVVVVVAGCSRDLFEGSAIVARFNRWRQKRHLARAPLGY
jgi:hypothetical protein